jgi:hypothetical protein
MPMVGEVQTVHRTLGVPWWSELAMGRRASLDDRRAAAESVSGKAKGPCFLDGFDGSEFARRARACGVFSQRRIRRGVHTDGSDRDVGIYTICFCHLWFGLFGRFPLVASRRLNSRRYRRRVILGLCEVRSCATQDSVGRRVQGRIDRAVWCETPILKTLELPSGCQPVYSPVRALRCAAVGNCCDPAYLR